jgi:Uma2 family endonuclease
MTPALRKPAGREIIYPESDGEPIAENTLQYRWIVTIHGNVNSLFKDDPNVFIAADLLWYPIEGDNKTRTAPDIMVVFGRRKGDRGSYQQWNEGGIAPQVVFEILSPGDRAGKMFRKFHFYEQHGVEEYYIYDPDPNSLEGVVRRDGALEDVPEMNGWVSPRLGIRFDMDGEELVIYYPDGRRFLTFEELARLADEERLARLQAQERANKAEQQSARLAEQLRKLGVEPDSQ